MANIDFHLQPVWPRVAYQVNFEFNDFAPRPQVIGQSVSGRIGRPGLNDTQNYYGFYRTRAVRRGNRTIRMPFFTIRNPQTEAQQANRQRFRDGVTAWNNLSDDEKQAYADRARPLRLIGYTLFLKEYLS